MYGSLTHTTQPPFANYNDGTQWEIGSFWWGKVAQILKYVHENTVKVLICHLATGNLPFQPNLT